MYVAIMRLNNLSSAANKG